MDPVEPSNVTYREEMKTMKNKERETDDDAGGGEEGEEERRRGGEEERKERRRGRRGGREEDERGMRESQNLLLPVETFCLISVQKQVTHRKEVMKTRGNKQTEKKPVSKYEHRTTRSKDGSSSRNSLPRPQHTGDPAQFRKELLLAVK
eukprot:56384-Hanusia_phi.AAC.1